MSEQAFVSWLHPLDVKSAFAESLLGMLAYDFLGHINEGKPRLLAGMRGHQAGVQISIPRNEVVREFLANPQWGSYLLLVDNDMTFDPDALERLMAVADPEKAPIVGGLCFGATDGELFPTLFELTEDDGQPCFGRYSQFPADALLRVGGTGAAFLLVHRKVFEAVGARRWPEDPYGHFPWFQETQLPAGPIGEDLTFCLRAGMCGFPIHVLTSLHIGHIKPTQLTAYRYFQQEGRIVEAPDTEPQPAEPTAHAPAPSERVAVTRIPGSLDDAALSAAMAELLAENPAKPPANLFPAAEGVMAHAA